MNDALEIINPGFPRGDFRVAIFDFDGTLSLLRRNWQGIMIPMMIEILVETGTHESREQLFAIVEEFVMRLTGKPTYHQMQALADEVTARGRRPSDPHVYLKRFQDVLKVEVEARIDAIGQRGVTPDEHMVPNSRSLLHVLHEARLALFLASGTLLSDVQREVRVLEIDEFFGPRVYGPQEPSSPFSKFEIVELAQFVSNARGDQVVGFGDGPVEIEAIKRAGGLAIGVASNEETGVGVSSAKRDLLIRAGADIIVGDFRMQNELLQRIELYVPDF